MDLTQAGGALCTAQRDSQTALSKWFLLRKDMEHYRRKRKRLYKSRRRKTKTVFVQRRKTDLGEERKGKESREGPGVAQWT